MKWLIQIFCGILKYVTSKLSNQIIFSLVDHDIKTLFNENTPLMETTMSTDSTTKEDCGNYCEEDDTLSYIVGAVCGVTVFTVLIWYIAMKVKESKVESRTQGMVYAVSIKPLSNTL